MKLAYEFKEMVSELYNGAHLIRVGDQKFIQHFKRINDMIHFTLRNPKILLRFQDHTFSRLNWIRNLEE